MQPYTSAQLKFFYCEPFCTQCNKLFKWCNNYDADNHLVSDTHIYIPLYYAHPHLGKVTGFALKGSEVESLHGVQAGQITFEILDSEFIHTLNEIIKDAGSLLKTVKEHYYPDICTEVVPLIKEHTITVKVDLNYQQTVFTDGQFRPIHRALLTDVHVKFIPEIHFKGIHVTPEGAILDLEILSAMVTDIESNIQPQIFPSEEIASTNITITNQRTIAETDDEIYYDIQNYDGCHDYCGYEVSLTNHWTLDDICDDAREDFYYDFDFDQTPEDYLVGPWKFMDLGDDILTLYYDIIPEQNEMEMRRFFSDRSLVLKLLSYRSRKWFKYIDLELKYDLELCKHVASSEYYSLYLPLQMRCHPDILVRFNEHRMIPKQVWKDKNVLRGLISKYPGYFKYIHDTLKADLDLVLIAVSVSHQEFIYQYIHPSLMTDINTVSAILEADFYNHHFDRYNNIYKYIDPSFLTHKESALILLRKSPHSRLFSHLSLPLQMDKEIVITAVSVNGLNLEYVNPSFKAKRKLSIMALEQNGMALRYIDACFKDDVEIALIAIKNNPDAVKYVSAEVKQRMHGCRTKVAR